MSERKELLVGEGQVRKNVEKLLAQNKGKFLTINQIANSGEVKAHWATLQKVLDDMVRIGRVHYERVGSAHAYAINGVGKWQQKFKLNENTWLFFDTFVGKGGEPFIRIKETKKENNEWQKFGEVMFTPDQLPEIIRFLSSVQGDINEYHKVKEITMRGKKRGRRRDTYKEVMT